MWITRVAIANPVFAAMVMVALCVLGLFSYARLNIEQLPDVNPPGAFVDVAYPGASPEAVEREINKPLEESINAIAGVKRITSRAFEGRGQTSVEFSLNADLNRAMQELRDRVSLAQAQFPRDAKQPFINRFNSDNAQPVVVMALLAPTRSARELSMLADQVVQRRLTRVEGVAQVELSGLAKREVRIDLDPARLRAYAITPAEVVAALREANADQPVGLLTDRHADAILRVEGRVRDPRRFADVVIGKRGNLPLLLADVGQLVEREREPESLARVDGQRAIDISIYKQQDANVVTTGDAIQAAMAELRKTLPPGVELRLIFAASDFTKASLAGLQRTLIEGALLTIAIVFLFLHSWRSTVITALTLPIAVISSFIAVYAFGFTLNFMTMMALSLCIGLLIDDAIVVRENIVRHLHMGKDHHRAAREGTDEIGLAVMATTFALCAVFVPVAFMGGIVGKFFYPFGITVAVAVLVSLFVSFTLDPMLSAVWRDPPAATLRRVPLLGALMNATDRALDALHTVYERLIRWVFSGRKVLGFIGPRAIVLAVGVASFAGALALAPLVGTEFIPQTDQGFTQLSLRMATASSLERSDDKVRQVEAIVATFPEVKTLSTQVGGQGNGFAVGRSQATLNIGLVDRKLRQRSQKQVEDAIRSAIAKIPGIEASVGFDRPIYVAILGTDSDTLARIATDFAEQVKKIPGIADVDLSVKPGLPAYAVRLKPDAVRELGLTAPQLAASLRAYVNGEVATYWTTPDGEQVEVLVRLPAPQRERVEQMRALPVAFARDGSAIALQAVADIEPVFNPDVIRRQNLQRREAIFAGVHDRPAGDVGADVQKLVERTVLPPGYSFDVGGQTKDQQEAFAAMVAAMVLAVTFIYIVLASQFGSFVQPIAIMASLPLALIGVMLALLVWRSTLNIFSMIGLVMLMGLVTKNAILLVDFANQARRAGASVADALLQAGLTRMRPIMMTTAAMVFGMLPLALALNEGGEIQAPMGRAIIGGVITSTLLTLVVVPVIYSFVARERKPGPAQAGAAMPASPAGGPMAAGMPADRE
ncbi:MAG: efflux RND transporter permease subunit [Ideonella sp.]|nr:efflux RND transporter permease subunit [Ideonella sp.]MCC7459328.1 efflux RND transporter permease subunit [Nitrospira sp.]